MLKLLKVGHCYHPEAMVMRGHSWRSAEFPAFVGLINHPEQGYVLFDTGYAKRFSEETSRFPEIFYRWLTPMHLCQKENLIEQLKALNVTPQEIRYIFISHFHADHISGLLDFPQAEFICSQKAFNNFSKLGRFKGLMKGYLPKLLPTDFETRCQFIEETKIVPLEQHYYPFLQAYDIFSDGSLKAISLPGHAAGQYGLLIEQTTTPTFLIGDATWTRDAFIKNCKPNVLTHLIMDSGKQYLTTLDKLSELYRNNKNIQIIPSHCLKSFLVFNNENSV